ncbi:type II restriction-modification system methylation subunit [Vibrio sp. RC586]|uniref:DNA cytosine methyltransferase n=3 Tax=Vibrio TaxID=662 RepID=UPI0001BB8320|nr:DNA cytosine methyltransferase [Vibrio sp. RC586]EEZ00742.1 type II restriction-modification system methylation subunit [Vibrio sp. RC586]
MKNKSIHIKPRTISLFSGCGGLDLGFHKAGFNIVFSNDIEKNVESTYRYNLGDILIKDITKIDIDSEIPNDIDVILAGIPCQPFSSAGNRKSMDDHRGGLFESVMDIVDKKKPKVVLFENVRGFISSKDDKGVLMPERIKNELLTHGYHTYWKLLKASDFEVPQNRHRVIIVGVRHDVNNNYTFPEPIISSDLTVKSVIENSILDDEEFEVWPLSPQAQLLSSYIPAGGSWKNIPDDVLPERLQRIRQEMKRYRSPNFYRKFNLDEIMGTITAAATPENSGILHPLENRRYSVREIARFQSFPDDFKFIGTSIPSKYKMIGNAVPPKLAYHIAKSILEQIF